MANENSNMNKDAANSLSKYSDYANKGTNLVLDSANQINKWYAEQLNKITENDINSNRLETSVDNSTDEIENTDNLPQTKIETKIDNYDELQTTNTLNNTIKISNSSRINTQTLEIDPNMENLDDSANNIDTTSNLDNKADNLVNKNSKMPKRIATAIKGAKFINNTANKVIKTGKTINTGLNEGGLKSFENTSSRIMTKPVKKVAGKATNKVTKKATNILVKTGKKVATKTGKQVVKTTSKLLVKIMKLLAKLMAKVMAMIVEMLPEIAPVIIILVVIVAFCSFFGLGMSEDTKKEYEQFMISVQDEYDKQTVEYYNQGKIVQGTIEGKGFINWKAPLAIIQMLNGDLVYDNAEKQLLNSFKNAGLYEKISEETYTYEKTTQETDQRGNVTTKKETVTETKKIVSNPSIDEFINWCNNNFGEINKYKKAKKIKYDSKQTKFTDSEVEQIKLLYNSNQFFDLFSGNFKERYAYLSVSIGDEQLQAIYNEFLNNIGTRYLMDHSNLKYDKCMDYYDCSSWVIHCLAHCGIVTIPNTGAQGIYNNHCYPISVDDRKAGDLIFLKDTYDTGEPGSISHIGIYMGELTINGETAEWVIDTGGNPSGVRIRKYKNGWWNGSNFYGFARLKGN